MKSLIRPIIKKAQSFYNQTFPSAHWESGIKHEVLFWDKYFKTKGLDWPEDYAQRLDPSLPLSDYHRQFVDVLPGESVKILDVGAGPLTVIGKTHPSKVLHITATDALAQHYDLILEKYQVIPPVRTQLGKAESLVEQFPESSFDFVNAQNCIDHSEDPFQAIVTMLKLTKPGCFVAMLHHENEAENEGYAGFHQWNFSRRDTDGHFIITGRQVQHDVTAELAPLATVHCDRQGNNVLVSLQKKAH